MERCEKYADWIAEAARGELALGREAELLSHAAECIACRESYQRARDLAALVDRGIESLVAGAPSPHFATRLRARIADERVSGTLSWPGVKPLAAGLLVATLGAIALISRGPQRHNPEQTNPGSRGEAPAGSPWASNSGRAVTPIVPSWQRADVAQPNSQRRRTLHSVSSPSKPEVLVPPGQLEAIIQFAEAVRSGRVNGQQLLAAQEEAEKPLEISPLEIAPLSPPQPKVTETQGTK